MKKFKSLIGVTLVALAITTFTFFSPNTSEAQQSEFKYAKSNWFGFDGSKMRFFVQEDCTSTAGGQCSQPRGSFRTYFDIKLFK